MDFGACTCRSGCKLRIVPASAVRTCADRRSSFLLGVPGTGTVYMMYVENAVYHAVSCGDDDDDDHVNPGSAAAATTDSTTLLSVRHFTLPCFGTNRHGYYLVYIIPFPIPISMEVSGGIIWSLYGWVRRGRNDPTFTAVPMRSSLSLNCNPK